MKAVLAYGQTHQETQQRTNAKMEAAIVKSTCIVVTGICTTTLAFALTGAVWLSTLLSVDYFFNMVLIICSFEFGQKWYNALFYLCRKYGS